MDLDYQDIKNQYQARKQMKAQVDGVSLVVHSVKGKQSAEQSARDATLEKIRAEAAREAILSSLVYASRIQKSLLPPDSAFEKAFSDYAVLWDPRDIVGGDVYWLKQYDSGTVLCVADCTGHGVPGALLTTLVVSAFEAGISAANCHDPADIIVMLDQKLSMILKANPNAHGQERKMTDINDGCDLAVFCISKNGDVAFSSANQPVFVCDGHEVKQIKGQRLHVGKGLLTDKNAVKITRVPASPDKKYYISSDGMFDQAGGERGLPFGYTTFKNIILENHREKQQSITKRVWDAFEKYRGNQERRDDFELIAFKP